MKKIISVLAMALLVIGAAQAQEQTRYMFIQKTNGQQIRIPTEEIQDVTFAMVDGPSVPTTVEEAQAMLVGYWKWNGPTYDEDVECYYLIITEDLKVLLCYKIKDSVTQGQYAQYAGKYYARVIWDEVTFTSEDPIEFFLGFEGAVGKNLQRDSFDLISSEMAVTFSRVEPFEFEPNYPPTSMSIDEAKAMLVGYWKLCVPIEEEIADYCEGTYLIITEDLYVLYCFKFKDSVTDEEFAQLAGKYIVGSNLGEVTFTNDDPLTFSIGEYVEGTNLQMDRFYVTGFGDIIYPTVRVEPFEYIDGR